MEKSTSNKDDEPIPERLRNQKPKDEQEIHQEYTKWKRNRTLSKLKVNPTINGKNWIIITKLNIFSMLRIQLSDYDEEKSVKLLCIKIKYFNRNKIWSMFKFHMGDRLITITEWVRIEDM